ncbi:MAG: glycosyltransferase [Armatimonadetes bacterium]|nr:glycosyltransferase [Armatimonadota bacterium]
MDDPRVTVLNTYRTERAVARNTGAALSRGDWLYFLDDDDYVLPGAFAAMLEVAERTRATHVYGGYRITDMAQTTDEVIRPDISGDIFPLLLAGETLPPQARWVRREYFFRVGGFDPLMVPVEDVDLFRRISRIGPVARTDFVVAVVRVNHPATTTTDSQRQNSQWLRSLDQCLSLPETLSRVLRRTAQEPYWRGRCARIYLGSAGRNLLQGRHGLAWGRLLAALQLSRLPSGDRKLFWRGFRRQPGEPLKPETDSAQVDDSPMPISGTLGGVTKEI